MSDNVVDALIASMQPEQLEALAERLGPFLARSATPPTEGWLDSGAAAAYLGISKNALHKLTARRALPFEQDGPGCKTWFRRRDLDGWRQGRRAQ